MPVQGGRATRSHGSTSPTSDTPGSVRQGRHRVHLGRRQGRLQESLYRIERWVPALTKVLANSPAFIRTSPALYPCGLRSRARSPRHRCRQAADRKSHNCQRRMKPVNNPEARGRQASTLHVIQVLRFQRFGVKGNRQHQGRGLTPFPARAKSRRHPT